MLLGVDVGGTFTDAVLVDGGRLITAKAPTTPADQSEGVLDAVRAALDAAGRAADDVAAFSHGMTVATNALLEGVGARTVLCATEGFVDVVELGRQARPELYRLCAGRPAPLVPPERRVVARHCRGWPLTSMPFCGRRSSHSSTKAMYFSTTRHTRACAVMGKYRRMSLNSVRAGRAK